MSSGSGASPVSAGRDSNQDDGDSRAEKGDNHGENQSVSRRPRSASGNQASTNQQQSPRQAEGHQKKFTHGSSGQNVEDKEEAMDSCTNRTGGAQGGTVTTAMTSAEDSPRTQGKKNACRDFHNIDYSGHFKINLVNKDPGITKPAKVLKMEIEEEQFVKFCHLFLCDLQLCAVKRALQSVLKLDVLRGGYPPSVCTQPGASEPVDTSVKSVLKSLCYQLNAVNISSIPWDKDQVRTILSSLESYQEGNVIDYEVSGNSLNYWLVGEQGAMKSAIEILSRNLGPRSNVNTVRQSPEHQDMTSKEPDGDITDYRDESPLTVQQDATSKEFDTADSGNEKGQQDRTGPTGRCPQQTGPDVSGYKQQQGTEQVPELQITRQGITKQELQSVDKHTSASTDTLRDKQGASGLDKRPPGHGGLVDSNGNSTQPSKGGQQKGYNDHDPPPFGRQHEGNGGLTRPSVGGQQEGTGGGPTGPSRGGQQGGTGGDPTRPSRGGQQGGTGGGPTGPSRGGQQGGTGGGPTGQSMGGQQEGTGGGPTGPSRGGQQEGTGGGPTGPSRGGQQEGTGGGPTRPSRGRQQEGTGGDPTRPSRGGQQEGTGGGPTRPSRGGQQEGTGGGPTGPSRGGQQEGTGNPNGPSMANLDTTKFFRSEEKEHDHGDIRFADEDPDHGSSLTETQKGYQQQLSEWSGQEANNPTQRSTTAPGDQNIDRYEGQGQNGKHEGHAGVQTGGHNTGVQNMMEPSTDRAVKLVTASVVCRKIAIEMDSDWQLFLDSQYVQQELSDLQKEHNGRFSITTEDSLVTLSCTADIEHAVLTVVDKMKDDFFKERIKTVQYTPDEHLTVELCTRLLQHDIQVIEKKYGVRCQPVENKVKQGWKVTGPCGTLAKAVDTLKEFSMAVTSRHLPLVDKVTQDFFKTQPGQDEMVRVSESTGCLVTLVEQEVADSGGTLGAVASTRQGLVSSTERSDRSNLAGRQWRLGNGLVVALYCGDGWKSASDAIVKLAQKKGTQAVSFQRYQDTVTVTLNLPEWNDGRNKEKDTIHKNFQEILAEATKKGYASLTVLLDDCNQCGWQGRIAFRLVVKSTLYVLQKAGIRCSCAYFIRDQALFVALRGTIDDSFRDVTGTSLTTTDETDEIPLDWEHIDLSDIRAKKPEIRLHKGELAKIASDVIVNTTDTSLRLNVGAVSTSILKGAGSEIQRECDQYYQGVKYGEAVITHGYKLQCKHVFHGALPRYSSDPQRKFMVAFLLHCLTEAEKKKYSSISFPALGTGNLGYPRDLVARTMFDTVNSYFNEWKDSSIERVDFVVYPKDTQTVKAFEYEEKRQRQSVLEGKSLSESYFMNQERAGLKLRYKDVDLWVTCGQIDKAAADGLLIFWDSSTLYKSPLPSCSCFNNNLNPKGVNALKDQRQNLSSKGMTVVTEAGSLPFKAVIHCLIKEDNIDLQTVTSVLAQADNQKLCSVILHLGIKESLTRFQERFVNQFHDALKQFSRKNQTLGTVEIMFDSEDTYKTAESHIRRRYAEKIVENKAVTEASMGVQTRSMTREALNGNSTKRTYETHLLVAGKLEDSIEKAIHDLRNKISKTKTQHQGQQTSSPTPASTDQKSPQPKRPPRTHNTEKVTKLAPNDDGVQDDYNSPPVNESTILETTEHEDRRLVLKNTRPSTLEKSTVEVWLKGNGVENFTVICPFLQDTEALIIFRSVNDAEKLLKKPSDEYTVKKFPPQTVQNLKATLKTAMVETIKECIVHEKIKDEIYRASGAEWSEENGTCFLKGSLPEIQCANRFIIRRTAGRNVRQDNQQRSHTDGEGAAQGGMKGGDAPDSQGNEQDKNTEPNTSYSKVGDSSSDITKRNDGQKSHSYSQYSQDTLVEENERQGAKGHLKSKSLQQNEPPDITTVQRRPISQGQEVSRLNPTQQLTGMNTVIDGKQNSGNGNKILASSESDLRSEEEEKRLKHVNQLGKSIDMKDENDFDNSLHFMKENDKEGSACQRTQPDNQSFPVKEEIVKCSAETFSEICFFNEGITNKVKVQLTDDRSECRVTDRNGVFKKAKDCLSAYARKEIYNLKKNEQSKFQRYYEQEMDNRYSMKIFCSYNHNTNSVQLVGQNYDMIEAAEQFILTAIGRRKGTSQGSVHMKKKPPAGSEVQQTRQELRVFVYQEDLLHLDVDAIIHGTNSSLDNCGDLGSRIAIAAGPDLERACANTFLKRGKLNIGECCITTAGNLHYQFIIHAVIMDRASTKPHKQQSKQLCQDNLCRSILNSLLKAEKSGARSVALPAIGRRLLSPEICTAAYKESVDLFCKKRKHSNVVEIHFVDQDKDILKKVEEVFQASKPQITRPVAPALQHVIRKVRYPFWMAKLDTGGTLLLNDQLTLCVMKQCFVDAHAAALVSVEDEQFESRRYVAREIEKKAGGRYRQEKENLKKGQKRPNISDVFHTRAGDMQNVSHVLHVIAPVPDSKTSQDMALWKGLTDSIRACYYQVFKKIDELKLDSIALPSLAMGTLKDGQTEELWQICVEEVVKYTKHPKPTSRLNRIILADPSANTTSFLIGLLDSMLPSLAMSESTV